MPLSPLRLLVTGASGFVGRGLLPELTARGYTGIACGRKPPTNLPLGWTGLCRETVLAQPTPGRNIDAIIHLEVRQHIPNPTAKDILDFTRVNVEGTHAWLAWATKSDIRKFVFASSIKAIGDRSGIRTEADTTPPDTPYGHSKAAAETLVRDWSRAAPGRSTTIVRSAPVYGPGNEANLAAFVRQIMHGRPCCVGNGETRKSVVCRRNLVEAMVFLLNLNTPGYEIYNVADKNTLSIKELATLVASIGGYPRPRSIPAALATFIAPACDYLTMLTGRSYPLTTARLNAMRMESIFPSDKLEAAGFHHPQTTQQGLREMIYWMHSQASATKQ